MQVRSVLIHSITLVHLSALKLCEDGMASYEYIQIHPVEM